MPGKSLLKKIPVRKLPVISIVMVFLGFILCWFFLPEPIKISIPHTENHFEIPTRKSRQLPPPTASNKIGVWFTTWKNDPGNQARDYFIDLLEQSFSDDKHWPEWGEIRTVTSEIDPVPNSVGHERAGTLGKKLNASIMVWGEVVDLSGIKKTDVDITVLAPIPSGLNKLGPISIGVPRSGFGQINAPAKVIDRTKGLINLVQAYSALATNNPSVAAKLFESAITDFQEPGLLAALHQMAGVSNLYLWEQSKSNETYLSATSHFKFASDHCKDYIDPRSGLCVNATVNLGVMAAEKGNPSLALKFYQQALSFDSPDKRFIYNNMGALYAKQGDLTQAIASYRKALVRHPEFTVAGIGLAQALILEREYESAKEVLNPILERNPNNQIAVGLLGNSLCGQKNYSEARTFLQSNLNRNPNNAYAHFALGDCLLGSGLRQDAIEQYKAGLSIDPENPPAKNVKNLLDKLEKKKENNIIFK